MFPMGGLVWLLAANHPVTLGVAQACPPGSWHSLCQELPVTPTCVMSVTEAGSGERGHTSQQVNCPSSSWGRLIAPAVELGMGFFVGVEEEERCLVYLACF